MDTGLMQKFRDQGNMLTNRVKKRFKHLRKRFLSQNIEVFRLYDWDIPEIRVVVDPPSFSTTRTRNLQFDIVADHPGLLEAVIAVMRKGGVIFFSTNHQDFMPRLVSLKAADTKEITDLTIPEDYVRNRPPIHRCWRITV